MNLNQTYDKLKQDLTDGKRGRAELTIENFQELKMQLQKILEDKSNPVMTFCLLGHATKQTPLFDELLLECLKSFSNPEYLIFALETFNYQTLSRKKKDGERINKQEIEILKSLLKHPNLEVIEWTLRTIEELGPQTIYFKAELKSWSSPKFLQNPLNKNYKNIRSLLKYIQESYRS